MFDTHRSKPLHTSTKIPFMLHRKIFPPPLRLTLHYLPPQLHSATFLPATPHIPLHYSPQAPRIMRDQLHSCFAYPLPPCMLPTGPQPPPSSQPLYSPRHRSALPLLPPPSRLTLAQPTPPLPAVIRLPDSLVKKALAKRARPLNRHPPSLPTRSHRQLLAAYAFQEGVTAE